MAELEKFPQQTARFSQLVAHAGRPAVHLTLVDPRKDRALQKLAGQGRVLSVHRHRRGEGAGYGVVGLLPAPGTELLVFPKSIKRAAGKRIVGIDFDLVANEALVTARPAALPTPARKTHAAIPAPSAQGAPPGRSSVEVQPPPTLAEIARELAALRRLLGSRKLADARAQLDELITRIDAGLRA